MTSHDTYFKQLLRTFFIEFLAAFVPELADILDPRSAVFLDKELIKLPNPNKSTRIVDLVARVQFKNQKGFVLIHVEHQARRQPKIEHRLFLYMAWLMEQYGWPVYPILLTSYDHPRTPEPNQLLINFPRLQVLDFRYNVIQLNRLDWRNYAKLENPAATALMSKMNIAPADRVKVKLQIFRLMARLQLDRKRMDLIAGFVDRYLSLQAKEGLAFQHELSKLEDKTERDAVMEIMSDAKREGIRIGKEEGELRIVQRQLKARLNTVPASLTRQVRALDLISLEALADALLDFTSVKDLRDWLKKKKR